MSERSSRIPGFFRLGVAGRRRRLAECAGLAPESLDALESGGLTVEAADGMVENAVGTLALPLGVATNFCIDGVDYLVPMAIEEPSVIAAASNAAKMVRAGGGFSAAVTPPVMIGQIQLIDVVDLEAAERGVLAAKDTILARAREIVPRLVERGGGPVDLECRPLPDPDRPGGDMLIVHILVDCRDAMGANLVNTIAEELADDVAAAAGARAGLRILSNHSDERRVRVRARIPDEALGGAGVRRAIAAASRFAELDPYRAATHNKGIMNGVDAVLLATANDWRGVEAGAHAYACRTGRYAPLATWTSEDGAIVGELDMPLAVGIVGGALHVHEAARLALAMLCVESAGELAAVVAAVGLATNLAALRALATDGIQRGHMSLHARVVASAAGASGDLLEQVAAELAAAGDVKPDRAHEILTRLQGEPLAHTLTLKETL
jgi:hydroxymethylglutaryl-CoA reductase